MGWSGEREKFLLNLIHKAGIVGFTFHIVYMVAYCDNMHICILEIRPVFVFVPYQCLPCYFSSVLQ